MNTRERVSRKLSPNTWSSLTPTLSACAGASCSAAGRHSRRTKCEPRRTVGPGSSNRRVVPWHRCGPYRCALSDGLLGCLAQFGFFLFRNYAVTAPTCSAPAVTERMQRILCPGPTAISAGSDARQAACTYVHRGAKAHPGGRRPRSGGLPGIAGSRRPSRRPPCARVARSPIV